MKRVLFIDHVSRILGGAEINLVELLNCPESSRHWQVVAAVSFSSPLHQRLEKSGAQLVNYQLSSDLNQLRLVNQRFPLFKGMKPLRSIYQAIRDLTGICREIKPDILVSCTNKDHFISGWVGRRLGIPSVWWVNDVIHPDFFSVTIRTIFRWLACRDADHLITVSDFAMRHLIELGIPESKIQRIHNGIPIATYRKQSELRFGLKAKLGISEDNPIIGFIGRLTPWKGPDFFLDLAERWIQQHPKGHFVLVGQAFNEEQDFESQLKETVRRRNHNDRVHFLPFVSPIAPLLSELDLFIHCSTKPEPFGRVIIEAMACGVPVLASADGGIPEIINSDRNGLLAEPSDMENYLAQMNRVLSDDLLRNRIREQGRKDVESMYQVGRVVSELDEVLDSVLS